MTHDLIDKEVVGDVIRLLQIEFNHARVPFGRAMATAACVIAEMAASSQGSPEQRKAAMIEAIKFSAQLFNEYSKGES